MHSITKLGKPFSMDKTMYMNRKRHGFLLDLIFQQFAPYKNFWGTNTLCVSYTFLLDNQLCVK